MIDLYGSNKDCSYNFATWDNAHDGEPVWDLRMHPHENLFISVGADYAVSLWTIPMQH